MIIKKYIVNEIPKIIKKSEDINKKLSYILNNFNNIMNDMKNKVKYTSEISLLYYEIYRKSADLLLILTDLFFLRRFLDKDYINNSIVYTGLSHLSDIVYLLVKYFDFEITNLYYYKNKKIPTKQEIIKSTIDELSYNFSNNDKYNSPNQCVNLFDFPDNFG